MEDQGSLTWTVSPDNLREIAGVIDGGGEYMIHTDDGTYVELKRPEPELEEVWLIRNDKRWAEPRYWSLSGWTPDIRVAVVYTERPTHLVSTGWDGAECVRFVEAPF